MFHHQERLGFNGFNVSSSKMIGSSKRFNQLGVVNLAQICPDTVYLQKLWLAQMVTGPDHQFINKLLKKIWLYLFIYKLCDCCQEEEPEITHR